MASFSVWNDWCGNNVVHVERSGFRCSMFKFEQNSSEWQETNLCHNQSITTEHMINFAKLGLRFHHNASLIKNAYCNCETPILFQLFKQNLATLFWEMERKKYKKEKKKNNTVTVFSTLLNLSCLYDTAVSVMWRSFDCIKVLINQM